MIVKNLILRLDLISEAPSQFSRGPTAVFLVENCPRDGSASAALCASCKAAIIGVLDKKKIKNGGRGKEEGAALFADRQTWEANVWRAGCKYADKGREKTRMFSCKNQVFLDQINPQKEDIFSMSAEHVNLCRRASKNCLVEETSSPP